jgi:hypothetical protein
MAADFFTHYLMRIIIFLGFFLTPFIGSSQHILAGKVTDPSGAAIPGVKVYVENTTYGIITDYNGQYYLELQEQKTYAVAFRMLGMNDTVIQVKVAGKLTTLDVMLSEEATALETVDVVVKKENIANSIIKKVQDNRKAMAHQFDNYTCNTYFKTSLFSESIPDKKDSIPPLPVASSLIESVSTTTFIAPASYHEEILAHHDYSDKAEGTSGTFLDYYMDDVITPMQEVEVDPYIFFEKTQDGDFDLYQSMINLPKISEHPIPSPIGMVAFTNYSFQLTNIFYEGDQKIYEIEVTPLYKGAALLQGHLYIFDETWIVKSFTFSVNAAALTFFTDFTVIQDYEKEGQYWVPVRREYSYTIKDADTLITANTRVDHSGYLFNQTFANGVNFKTEISHYNDEAFSRDSLYWSTHRPIQLKTEELDFIAAQNRIDSIKQSEHYLDSLDAEFNKITFFDVTLNGIGLRNRYKKQEIYIAPLLNVDFFGVGGFRYEMAGSYSKKFENAHALKVSPRLNYGFRTRDLKYVMNVQYTFLPRKFGMIEVTAGDMYERLTNQLNAINWLLGGNSSVRNQFYDIAYRQELVNGFYGRVKFSYADRQPLDSTSMGPLIDYLQSVDTSSLFDFFMEPVSFERYTVSMLEVKLQYRFRQKYMIKNNEKLIIGTEYPELEFTFKQGIPDLFNSEVNFNYMELKVSDEINFGNFGDSRWKVIGGIFMNTGDLRIIEHKYFKAADVGLFSNPLNTHQTLDTLLNTGSAYAQAFYLHHFNGILFNKIPLIRKLKFEGIAGTSMLTIPDQDFLLTEFYFGVERKFRIRNQYLKYGFYYVIGSNTKTNALFKLKIGFDSLNTFTNQWSW